MWKAEHTGSETADGQSMLSFKVKPKCYCHQPIVSLQIEFCINCTSLTIDIHYITNEERRLPSCNLSPPSHSYLSKIASGDLCFLFTLIELFKAAMILLAKSKPRKEGVLLSFQIQLHNQTQKEESPTIGRFLFSSAYFQ